MSVIYDAVDQIEQEAAGAISGAVDNAQQQVRETARAIEAIANETVDKSVVQSLADLHAVVSQLIERDTNSHNLINEIHTRQGAMQSTLDGLAQPVTAATNALAAVADAVAQPVEQVADATGVPVAIQPVMGAPKSTAKKLFGKKPKK